MNRGLTQPVVDIAAGGVQGGGAVLTELAQETVERYRAIEARAAQATAVDLAWLQDKIAK
jgi:molybdate transport system regulatory protein